LVRVICTHLRKQASDENLPWVHLKSPYLNGAGSRAGKVA